MGKPYAHKCTYIHAYTHTSICTLQGVYPYIIADVVWWSPEPAKLPWDNYMHINISALTGFNLVDSSQPSKMGTSVSCAQITLRSCEFTCQCASKQVMYEPSKWELRKLCAIILQPCLDCVNLHAYVFRFKNRICLCTHTHKHNSIRMPLVWYATKLYQGSIHVCMYEYTYINTYICTHT
jgi:hypothetical protein